MLCYNLQYAAHWLLQAFFVTFLYNMKEGSMDSRTVWQIRFSNMMVSNAICVYTVGSRLATVRFTTVHFYDPCRVRPSTADLWHITVATQASFLYLVHF